MNENEVALLEKLADSLGIATTEVVGHYVQWFIWDSIVWIAIGLIMVISSARMKLRMIDIESMEIHSVWPKTILLVVGVIFIGVNLVDLMAPHGIAIHQIFKDLTGK